ncbi:hypothetical protein [Blastococcus sp. SYSU DS1024]
MGAEVIPDWNRFMVEYLLLALVLATVSSLCQYLAFHKVWTCAWSVYKETGRLDDLGKVTEAAGKFPPSKIWGALSSAIEAARGIKPMGEAANSGDSSDAVEADPTPNEDCEESAAN